MTEGERGVGPESRVEAEDDGRQRLVEAVLACATVLALCTVVLAAPFQEASPGAFLAVVGFGALAVLGGAAPRLALCLTVLGIFAYYTVGLPPLGMVLPAVGALYLAAARGRLPWAVGGAVVLLAVATYFRLADPDPSAGFTGYEYVTELALAAASIALGTATRFARQAQRQGRRIAELVAAEQAHLAERRVQQERLRISRDLHDTVGHQLTVAALHASVASEALDAEPAPQAARDAVERVRAAGAETLRELRGAVRLLRSDVVVSDVSVSEISEPDPIGVAGLARTAREAGLRVEVEADPPPLTSAVAEAAGGILTEAVTNVLRHAAAATLRLGAAAVDGSLRLTVSDDGVGADPARLDTGHGVAGMRERAELLGGSLRVETAPGDGCLVRAELPLEGLDTTGADRGEASR